LKNFFTRGGGPSCEAKAHALDELLPRRGRWQ
jgi:hypothetical protein